MGTVYRAIDTLTGRPVALKVMGGSAGAQDALRFAREARLLAELRHPGIVAHVASGQSEDGRPYLAMDWLEGEDLARRLRRRGGGGHVQVEGRPAAGSGPLPAITDAMRAGASLLAGRIAGPH